MLPIEIAYKGEVVKELTIRAELICEKDEDGWPINYTVGKRTGSINNKRVTAAVAEKVHAAMVAVYNLNN